MHISRPHLRLLGGRWMVYYGNDAYLNVKADDHVAKLNR